LSPGIAGVGGLYDGDFARQPGDSPFDWSLGSGVGWSAAIGDNPSGAGKALNVEYDGVSPPGPVRELMVLAPGVYRLAGRFYDETGAGAPAFAWTVACAGVLHPLAAAPAPPGPANAWRAFSVEMTIPADNCAAQWLSLQSQSTEMRQDFSVWYTGLTLTRLAAAAPGPQGAGIATGPAVSPG
jgi:hypothetical protein